MTFYDYISEVSWSDLGDSIYAKTSSDVEKALEKDHCDIEDFKAFISPAAEPFLELMARKSHLKTQKRFGKTIQLYIPLYLSNECQNICTYCGFSMHVKIPRKTLLDYEIIEEAKIIKSMGYDHVLLVTGEANKSVGVEYFKNAIRLLKPYFSNIALEVQPMEQSDYEELIDEGLNTVLVYQETYNESNYKMHHPKGKKSNYKYRVETQDRLGQAKIHKMGLGVLIGLEDWRIDSVCNAMHLQYLERVYWRSKYTVSFPRLRPCAGGVELKSVITDKQLVQLICAYRLFNEELELSMSTRESAAFRDNIIKLGITSISADSKTDPGGYANPKQNLEQFEIDDSRSTDAFVDVIRSKGYDPVFKDWDMSLQ